MNEVARAAESSHGAATAVQAPTVSPGKSSLGAVPLTDGPVPASGSLSAPGQPSRPAHAAWGLKDGPPEGAQQAAATPAPATSETPQPAPLPAGAVKDAPSEVYVVPFDTAPIAAAGERIICRAHFAGGADAEYEIVFTTAGGHFTSAAGAASVTVQGLTSGNVDFFVPAAWNGTTALSHTITVKKKSDGSAAFARTWTYAKKTEFPTTMTQKEGTGEVALPGIYTYDIGPAKATGAKPFWQHQTILERFDPWSIDNIAPADIKQPYRDANGLTSTAAITAFVIGAYANNNGTFTVDANDQVADQHSGHQNVDALAAQLVTPKPIQVALPQTYEAKPGTALAKFMVTRVHKTDGTWVVKKAPR